MEEVMAEFCLECWNKLNKTNDSYKKYIFSDYLELCEGCGEWKIVIVAYKSHYYYRKLRYILFPFVIVWKILDFLFRVLMIPYNIYRMCKIKAEDVSK